MAFDLFKVLSLDMGSAAAALSGGTRETGGGERRDNAASELTHGSEVRQRIVRQRILFKDVCTVRMRANARIGDFTRIGAIARGRVRKTRTK